MSALTAAEEAQHIERVFEVRSRGKGKGKGKGKEERMRAVTAAAALPVAVAVIALACTDRSPSGTCALAVEGDVQ